MFVVLSLFSEVVVPLQIDFLPDFYLFIFGESGREGKGGREEEKH